MALPAPAHPDPMPISPRRGVARALSRALAGTLALAPVAVLVVASVAGIVALTGPAPAGASGAIGASAAAPAEPVDGEQASFEVVAALDELTADHARLFRLYHAFFDRSPDAGGALYWIEQQDACLGLDAIAELFAGGPEFANRYGPLGDRAFVERIYRNVLGRGAEAEGADYWTGLLTGGTLTRGGVVLNVSLSPEFTRRHAYPSDGVPTRSCQRPAEAPTGRSVHVFAAPTDRTLATVAGLTLRAPAAIIERAGFHQSTHPGALALARPDPAPIRTTVMASRNRGTDRRGAIDVAVEPTTDILAPIAGTVARAGNYTLYCRYRDGFVVINPDGRPDLEVKLLHIQDVAVRAGDRVEVGDHLAANATPFPFTSQIDELTGEPSWPHVHLEVVDPSIPRKPSSGSC